MLGVYACEKQSAETIAHVHLMVLCMELNGRRVYGGGFSGGANWLPTPNQLMLELLLLCRRELT